MLVLETALYLGRYGEFFLHREHGVRFTDDPTLGELLRGRRVLRVALRTTLVDPTQQRVAVSLG